MARETRFEHDPTDDNYDFGYHKGVERRKESVRKNRAKLPPMGRPKVEPKEEQPPKEPKLFD